MGRNAPDRAGSRAEVSGEKPRGRFRCDRRRGLSEKPAEAAARPFGDPRHQGNRREIRPPPAQRYPGGRLDGLGCSKAFGQQGRDPRKIPQHPLRLPRLRPQVSPADGRHRIRPRWRCAQPAPAQPPDVSLLRPQLIKLLFDHAHILASSADRGGMVHRRTRILDPLRGAGLRREPRARPRADHLRQYQKRRRRRGRAASDRRRQCCAPMRMARRSASSGSALFPDLPASALYRQRQGRRRPE